MDSAMDASQGEAAWQRIVRAAEDALDRYVSHTPLDSGERIGFKAGYRTALEAAQHRQPVGSVAVPREVIEAAIDTYEGEWGPANNAESWPNVMRRILGDG